LALCRWPGNIMHWQLTNRQWTHTMHWVNPRTTLDVVAKRISVISGITHWSARSQIVILLNELYKHTNSRKWQRDQQSSPFVDHKYIYCVNLKSKNKGVPRHAKVVQGVLGRLRPRIFLTFQHYKGGRLSAKRTGHLYPGRNPWYSLSEAESTSGHMVLLGVPRKKTLVTPPGIDPSD